MLLLLRGRKRNHTSKAYAYSNSNTYHLPDHARGQCPPELTRRRLPLAELLGHCHVQQRLRATLMHEVGIVRFRADTTAYERQLMHSSTTPQL